MTTEKQAQLEDALHETDHEYKPDAYKAYTTEELTWWVHLLTKRASHRAIPEKAKKDIHDAKVYLMMLEQMLTENV